MLKISHCLFFSLIYYLWDILNEKKVGTCYHKHKKLKSVILYIHIFKLKRKNMMCCTHWISEVKVKKTNKLWRKRHKIRTIRHSEDEIMFHWLFCQYINYHTPRIISFTRFHIDGSRSTGKQLEESALKGFCHYIVISLLRTFSFV